MSTFTMDGYLAQLHQGLFAYFHLRKLSYYYTTTPFLEVIYGAE